ncbi:spore protease YyaC [Cohnella zeiphila]|uniref:Spore protease YyaC n=1 Tax=Cohnella zeiphila TaxID=2761120 RepID=A0A7X0STS1_9BACL|nr:spore protease YyaC [Cohnella zeiphila]MBB6735994.1 spore protease YyaC [Cohnella zeiphila]
MLSNPARPVHLNVLYTDPAASSQLSERLGGYFRSLLPGQRLVVVCLGTDRSTGDSLGPLTGTALSKYRSGAFELFGTLADPVHALNLESTLERVRREVPHPFIIGIDACLGKSSSVGYIQAGDGPIHPGAGVQKKLAPVGDIHLSGVVNIGGFLDHYVLQSTRLHVVMGMSEVIARSLHSAVRSLIIH